MDAHVPSYPVGQRLSTGQSSLTTPWFAAEPAAPPIDIEAPNPNPDETQDDGLGLPPAPEPITDADVDEEDA